MKEIDLLIEQDGVLYPIEVKKHSDPTLRDISSFDVIDRLPAVKRGNGGVICTYDNLVPLSKTDMIIPVLYL